MKKSIYEVIQISNNAWRIEENGVRSLLFAGMDQALLIDTGFGAGDLRAVVESLTTLPIMLVNTHADRDHLGCNNQFDTVYIHTDEIERYRQSVGNHASVKTLQEGEIIDIGNRRFEVIHIPGHTSGSIALLDEENKVLISGDSVQAGMIFMFGPGRDIDQYISSLEKLIDINNKLDLIYPAHGPFPVDAGILPDLLRGVESVRAGSIQGSSPPFDVDAKLYDISVAKVLY